MNISNLLNQKTDLKDFKKYLKKCSKEILSKFIII